MVGFVIGQISGWAVLSRRFRDRATFGADETGLYMSVLLPFRVGHAPLFIPWAEIQVSSSIRGGRKLLLGRQESIPLLISVSLADKIKSAAGQAWPVATLRGA